MKLYKTIEHDKEMIKGIKNGDYPNWKIIFENVLYIEIEEVKENK